MLNGQEIRFPDEGDQGPNIIPGDGVIVLEEKTYPYFTRKGQGLFYKAKIDLLKLCILTFCDFRWFKANYGRRMPTYKRPFGKGSLYIKFEIEFPKKGCIFLANIKKLENILPPRPLSSSKTTGDMIVDDVVLSDPEPRRQQHRGNEDEGDYPGVKCTQQ
jgi:DnaJ homolog subfamily A member 2